MVIIENSNKIKSTKASVGFCKKKNEKLHRTFSKRFAPNIIAILVFCFLEDFVHAKNNESAIRKNKMFQTTGKTQLGGVRFDFTD